MRLVVRLLDHRGVFHPRTYALGKVEIRNRRADTRAERQAVMESAKAFGDERPNDCMRIATLVEGDLSDYEAGQVAEERFDEALDVLAPEVAGLSRLELLGVGFFADVDRGRLRARMPPLGRAGTTSFRMMREQFPQADWAQFLLGRPGSELAQRLVRSYHWSRKAQLERSRQLRVLFRWFAMEAIWMIEKEDDIVPRLRWSLGFPNGRGLRLLSARFAQRLAAHPTIAAWDGEIGDLLVQVKKFRNDSVHSGFRRQDVPRETLRAFDKITLLACGRVQGLAQAAIRAGLPSARDLFDYLPLLVECDANYVEDVHGTILFTLENPMPFQRED